MPNPELMQMTPELEQELTNLRGFRDLVHEKCGYWLGRKLKQKEMNEATEDERAVVTELRKEITGKKLKKLIEAGDMKALQKAWKDTNDKLEPAREAVTKKSKSFRKKISPLTKAIKFMTTVAIPDALKQIGKPVQPRFNLSDFVKSQLAQQNK